MSEKEFKSRFKNEIENNQPIVITEDIIESSMKYAVNTMNIRLYATLLIIPIVLYCLKDIADLIVLLISGAIVLLTIAITVLLVKKYALYIQQNYYLMRIHKYNRKFGAEYEDIYKKSLSIKSKSEFLNMVSLLLLR